MPDACDLLMRRMSASRRPGRVHRVIPAGRLAARTRCGESTFDLHVVTRCEERELCARCETSARAEEARRAAKKG